MLHAAHALGNSASHLFAYMTQEDKASKAKEIEAWNVTHPKEDNKGSKKKPAGIDSSSKPAKTAKKSKPALTAFKLFCGKERATVLEGNQDTDPEQIMELLALAWTDLSDEEREPFELQAKVIDFLSHNVYHDCSVCSLVGLRPYNSNILQLTDPLAVPAFCRALLYN